jgi:cation diffusion facilitator CzcD-associated flavoprotein CzcO
VLNRPKLPNIAGILDYQGEVFHSSRWDYTATGGSPAEQSLDKLKNKRVAVIGTGASAVQMVPAVAQWAKHLYVVQRTPSSVDMRHQSQTDSETFKTKIAPSKGWQRERHRNFHLHFTTGPRPEVDLVNDQWTSADGLVVIAGNPDPTGPNSPDDLPAYMKRLHILDVPRQERIRGIVDSAGMYISSGPLCSRFSNSS